MTNLKVSQKQQLSPVAQTLVLFKIAFVKMHFKQRA